MQLACARSYYDGADFVLDELAQVLAQPGEIEPEFRVERSDGERDDAAKFGA